MDNKKTIAYLEAEFSEAERDIRFSATLSKTISRTFTLIGISAAILIAAMGFQSSNAPKPEDPSGDIINVNTSTAVDTDIKDINERISDIGERVANLEGSTETHYDSKKEHGPFTSGNGAKVLVQIQERDPHLDHPIQEISGDTYLVRMMPQAWYRTELRQRDTFWALPDATFQITAEELIFDPVNSGLSVDCSYDELIRRTQGEPPWVNVCYLKSATLRVHSTIFNFESFSIGQENIPEDGSSKLLTFLGTKPDRCEKLREDDRPALRCEFSKKSGAVTDISNICIWLRRSEDREKREGTVAIDVKWNPTRC